MPLTEDADAVTEFTRVARPDECIALTSDEVTDILVKFKRGSEWSAATAFNIGDRIIPTSANRNGHRFKAVAFVTPGSDQKTGASEPSWTVNRDARITDGNVIWQEDGWDWDAILWDINGAAAEAWRVKAGKASPTSDLQTSTVKIASSQLFDHCMKMVLQFQRHYVL